MLSKDQLRRLITSGDPDAVQKVQHYLQVVTSPYHSFIPRPDNPHEGDQQASFVDDQIKGIACVLGGNSSGKSYSGAYKVARFLRTTPPPRKNTPYWIVSQTMQMASENNWGKNLSTFIGDDLIQDISWYNKIQKLPKAVILKPHPNGNNWIITFNSYDMERKALQGHSLGGWWADELAPYPILMELNMRCRDYDFPGSRLYTLTPLVDGSKNYSTAELEEIYKDQANRPEWKFYRLNSMCNTALPDGFMERVLASELEDLRETRATGAFCTFSGAIYKSFGDHHLCKPFAIPDEWWHVRAIDFGWSHETAVVWVARDPKGVYYVYNEYCRQKALLKDHLEAINAVPWGRDRQYWGECWADYAAAQERRELAEMGLETSQAKKDVLPGIACVQRLLREGRLLIFDSCKQLIRQMRSYRWSPTVKDKVDKQDDDATDALRYALFNDERSFIPPEEFTEVEQAEALERLRSQGAA